MKRDLLALADLGRAGIVALLDRADELRALRERRGASDLLRGRVVVLVFEKPSTRTRVSLEVAAAALGAQPVVLDPAGSQLGRGESAGDTARTLAGYANVLAVRTGARARLEAFAAGARTASVVNALTDDAHPLQVLADLLALRAARGGLERLRAAWVGDATNVCRSWIEAAGLLGLELTIAAPAGYAPPEDEVETANRRGGRVRSLRDAREAVTGAEVVLTDTWTSMGVEHEEEARRRHLAPYRLDAALLGAAAPGALVLHCLPAHRGEEIDDEILDGPRSLAWHAAAARLPTAMAALEWAGRA